MGQPHHSEQPPGSDEAWLTERVPKLNDIGASITEGDKAAVTFFTFSVIRPHFSAL